MDIQRNKLMVIIDKNQSLTVRNINTTSDKGSLKLHSLGRSSEPSSCKRNFSNKKIYRMGYKQKYPSSKDLKNLGQSDIIQENTVDEHNDTLHTEQNYIPDLMEVPEDTVGEFMHNEDSFNTVKKVTRPRSAIGNNCSTTPHGSTPHGSKPWV
jgi:hypothetical protein